MRRYVLIIGIVIATISGSYLWIYRPFEKYNQADVLDSLQSLSGPYKEISTSHWMDGGSIGVYIIDSKGVIFEGCLLQPNYERFYYGASHPSKEGARELYNPEPTIQHIVHILRTNPNPSYFDDLATAKVSGRLRDTIRLMFRNVTKQSSEYE